MSPELLVVSKLKTLTIDRQHEVLNFIEFLQAKQAMLESQITSTSTPFKFDENATPIWEIAAAITNQIPDDEWRKLPTDLAMNFDQYQKQGQD
jgi:type I restriction enzyme, S subunit